MINDYFFSIFLSVLIFLTLLGIYYWLDLSDPVHIAIVASLIFAIFYHLHTVFPFTPFHKKEIDDAKPNATGERIKILTCNVRMSNEDAHKLMEVVKKWQPGAILLTEVNQRWIDDLQGLN